MGPLIAGNGFSLLAMVTDSVSSSRKTARGVLLVQILSQVFYGISTIILGGYSSSVQNGIGILRNVAVIRNIHRRWLEWTLVVLGVVLGLAFNNLGPVGWIPVLANLEYTLAVFRFKDNERALKAAFLINAVLFAVFNVVIWNFVGVLSNTVVFISLIVYFVRNGKKRRQKEEEQEEQL